MSEDSMRLSLAQLPLEVLHAIFYHIDIPDILRIRRASRYLNQVSHSRHVWSDAYQMAKFVRPPGPFPSQSARDLEKTLVTSFRVDRYLRHSGGTGQTGRPTPLKPREIRYTGADLRAKLVFGRFLFIAFKKKISYYDLNLDASNENIIYQTTGDLRWFDCASAIDIEGRSFACAVLNEVTETTRRISIYLLNIGEHSGVTLELLHQFERSAFEIDSVELGPRVIIVQGRSGRTSDSDWHFVALDVYTRTQLLLPSIPTPWEASERTTMSDALPKSISTSTHLVQAWSSYSQTSGWSTLFTAFALPVPSTRCCSAFTSVLMNPSHQSTVPGINVKIGGPLLLHDAVVDSSTQDVLIMIRVHASEPTFSPSLPSQLGILRLSNTHTTGDHEVGAVTFQPFGFLGNCDFVFHHPSFNGSGRVFELYLRSPNWIVAAFEYNLHDAVNHADGQEVQVIEYPLVLQLPALHMRYLDYDPYSGRICLRYWTRSCSVVEIFDLSL